MYTVTDRNIAFSGTLVTCYLLSFWNLFVNPVHFLLTENIKRDNHTILLLNIKCKAYVYSSQNWRKASSVNLVNLAFILVFKPHIHKFYILRH